MTRQGKHKPDYYQRNRVRILEYRRNYNRIHRIENRERDRAYSREASGKYYQKNKKLINERRSIQLFAEKHVSLGSCCEFCGAVENLERQTSSRLFRTIDSHYYLSGMPHLAT